MTRDDIIRELKRDSFTVAQLTQRLGKSTSAIENDLEHIRTTIRNDATLKLKIQPGSCLMCGYMFQNKIKAPTKCAKCHKEKIQPPTFMIEVKKK